MSEVKFGVRQRKNPTPSNISRNIDLFSACSAVIVTWLGTAAANFIPSQISAPIASLLGLFIALSLAAKPFFGIKTSQRRVDIDDVTAMEDPNKGKN